MQVQFRGNRTAHKWLVCMLLVLERVLAFDMSISGKLSSYTLYGFNNKRYDPSKFIYPTGSYTSLLAEMNVSMDLYKGLHAEVGGMLSALPYDSTAYQGNDIQPGQPGGPGDFYNHDGGIYWEYIGWYAGHSGLHVQKPRYAMVNNAYISYDYKGIFGIKGGRYELSDYDWFTSFSQGVEGYVKYKDYKLRVLYSDARASASSDWFWPFGRYYTSGKPLMIAEFRYQKGHWKVNPYFYSIFGRMNAPGINITYDTNPHFRDKGFRWVGTFVGFFPFFPPSGRGYDMILFGQEKMGKAGQTLFFRSRFYYNKWIFGGSIYKNIGNANGDIGIYGDPLGYNMWTNTIYDAEINNIVGKDALNGFLYFGSHFHGFTWKVLGRLTGSPRANEQSVALFLSYFLSRYNLKFDLKLEYYNNITKKGYCLGFGYGPTPNTCGSWDPATNNFAPRLTRNIDSDRSHLMFTVTYGFQLL
ncbi:membrane protein [Helicobacter heilmannii]|uniref:Putative Outer membrane protein n=2 Tax=Helicobacter heilmannii TaxID=35817 RepID=A0A0K2Y8D7_HELHE|nr:outer membrane family protein [Helicobacter heilmannii]BDQ27483.1 membrane protein [Helicobacter heilmannii]CRI33954.1 putative Outer membrane protein [Helicobacter heilmannii]